MSFSVKWGLQMISFIEVWTGVNERGREREKESRRAQCPGVEALPLESTTWV